MNTTSAAIRPSVTNHIAVIDGQLTTTTQDIAEVYGKRHDHVLRLVRQRMEEAGEWGVPNFGETVIDRQNPSGGEPIKSPVIRMTEKGFMFVVGKFTGAKAVQHQIAYVDEFERMKTALLKNPAPDTMTVTAHELDALVQQRISKYLENRRPPVTSAMESWARSKWLTSFDQYGVPSMTRVPEDSLVTSFSQIRELLASRGFALVPQAALDMLKGA